MVKGIGGSAGYGVGKIVIISNAKPEYTVRPIKDTEAEVKRYEDAVEAFEAKTQAYSSSIAAVTVGTGDKAVQFGGNNVLPFYSFDAPIVNAPAAIITSSV